MSDTKRIVVAIEHLFSVNPRIYHEVARRMNASAPSVNIHGNQSFHLKRQFKRKVNEYVRDDGTVELLVGSHPADQLLCVRGFTIGVLGYNSVLLVFEGISGETLLGPVIDN